jgi:OmpA-OmpF porin, OOP family
MRSALLAAPVLTLALATGQVQAQPISGFYVGGSAGVGLLEDESIRGFVPSGAAKIAPSGTTLRYRTGWVGLGSLGYALGNGVRLELEGGGAGNDLAKGRAVAGVARRSGKETKYGAFGNVFFDMDIGSPYIYPYLGAGAGYQSVRQTYAQTSTSGTVTESFSGNKGAFAYQAMFGASLPVPGVVGLSVTTEYRFVGLSGTRDVAGTLNNGGAVSSVTRKTTVDNNHEFLLGLRYAFNVTPPSAPAAAVPAPVAAVATAPATARSYLVFFDWDSATLSERSRQIIADAALASTRVAATRIELAGHADLTGTPAYNQELSRKRAAVVAAELVQRGVAPSVISVSSFGDTRPLVATASGVREPQNRRVEIVLK